MLADLFLEESSLLDLPSDYVFTWLLLHAHAELLSLVFIFSREHYIHQMGTVRDFIFLGSKITVEVTAAVKLKDTCSLEETNLDSILKSKDITLPTKVHIVQAMFFPIVMYGCESWTIKKAKH